MILLVCPASNVYFCSVPHLVSSYAEMTPEYISPLLFLIYIVTLTVSPAEKTLSGHDTLSMLNNLTLAASIGLGLTTDTVTVSLAFWLSICIHCSFHKYCPGVSKPCRCPEARDGRPVGNSVSPLPWLRMKASFLCCRGRDRGSDCH